MGCGWEITVTSQRSFLDPGSFCRKLHLRLTQRPTPRPFRQRPPDSPRVEKINNPNIHSSPNSKSQFLRLRVIIRVDLKLSAATFQASSCPRAPPLCPSGSDVLSEPSSIIPEGAQSQESHHNPQNITQTSICLIFLIKKNYHRNFFLPLNW